MKKSVIEILNTVLEEIERNIINYVGEHGSPPISALREIHQDHQVVLYFRDVLARRHAEPAQDGRLCRDEVISKVDKLIQYHSVRCGGDGDWITINHRQAAETMKMLRDHLDRCYEIRSCD